MDRKLLVIPVVVVVAIVLVLFMNLHAGLSFPLNQTVLNETFGGGNISGNSGSFKVQNGYVIVHQLNGEVDNTTLAQLGVGIYQPNMVSSGVVEYVNGTGYHVEAVVLKLQNVVSSNYTLTINGNGTTIIIVHRGYAEADLFYFGGNLSKSQDQALITVLSRYLESL
ncbi:hypothetical protein [Metallosphaera hakonensis]|uniref:Uncharacterized protein n=1 Tax=Metallosphaera hakonensis JCM 8857 = DSM 7519 TaxID=1293036 RepID=A0A2U9IV14_9CREN|nr:hypothetical protein [Metallosphaera hakonensis]AWR99906.1 hypothetical protein DFR87_09630 [Metallosphaera hakonensis JCM 8857 = DSM 7519]